MMGFPRILLYFKSKKVQAEDEPERRPHTRNANLQRSEDMRSLPKFTR